jgi:hypothetical protein
MDIKVTIGTTTDRFDVIVPSDETIKETLENSDVMWEAANIHIDGAQLMPGDINKTYEDFGIEEECRIIAVVKTNNA